MINFIDRALEQFLRDQVPLPESSIGVSFETPDKAWGSALNRPTVNVFLWDLSRSSQTALTGLDQRRSDDGIERRLVNPAVDFHYLITAWATEVRDEHQLLGSILQSVMSRGQLPPDSLPAGTIEGPGKISLASSDDHMPGEFWSALGGRLKPGLQLKVTASLPVYDWQTAAAPPTSIDLGVDSSVPVPVVPAQPTARWVASEPSGTRRVRRTGTVTRETRETRSPGHE